MSRHRIDVLLGLRQIIRGLFLTRVLPLLGQGWCNTSKQVGLGDHRRQIRIPAHPDPARAPFSPSRRRDCSERVNLLVRCP